MTAHAHRHNNDRCGHYHNARAGGDTTQTQTIQAEYARRLRGHLARLNARIRKDVGERDVLGLADNDGMGGPRSFGNQEDDDSGVYVPEEVPTMEFPTDESKIPAFQDWFQQQLRFGFLEEAPTDHNRYVRSAYARGIRNSENRLSSIGVGTGNENIRVLMETPRHVARLQKLYTRNFGLLEDIAEDMAEEVGRTLTRSFVDGVSPSETANRLTDRVNAVGKTRATTLARTEVMNANHEATMARYQDLGVNKVDILVDAPCTICEGIAAGGPYTLANARGLLPAHPNCVCSYAPVVDRRR